MSRVRTCAEFRHLQSADLCRVVTFADCGPMVSWDLCRVGTCAEQGLVHIGDLFRMGTYAEWRCGQSGDFFSVGTCAECRHLCISNMCRVLTSDMCWPVQQSVYLGKVWTSADCRPLHIVHLYRDWTCQSMDLCRDGNWVNYGPVQILDLSSVCTSAENRPVQSLYLCRTLQSWKLLRSQICA